MIKDLASHGRSLANNIRIPFCHIDNTSAPRHKFKLNRPDEYWEKNHLVHYDELPVTSPGGTNGIRIRATFHMHSAYECARITQWYEFYETVNPWVSTDTLYPRFPIDTSDVVLKVPVPPFGEVIERHFDEGLYPAEAFVPITYYEWLPRCTDIELEQMEHSTLFWWFQGPDEGSALSADSDDFLDQFNPVGDFIWKGVHFRNNPESQETLVLVLFENEVRDWDNFHFNPSEKKIDAPGGLVGAWEHVWAPGGPQLVHMHWAWGEWMRWPDGLSYVPRNERGCQSQAPTQSVFISVLAGGSNTANDDTFHERVLDAQTFYDEAGGSVRQQSMGYTAWSANRSNAFFAHGIGWNGLWSLENEANRYPDLRAQAQSTANQ